MQERKIPRCMKNPKREHETNTQIKLHALFLLLRSSHDARAPNANSVELTGERAACRQASDLRPREITSRCANNNQQTHLQQQQQKTHLQHNRMLKVPKISDKQGGYHAISAGPWPAILLQLDIGEWYIALLAAGCCPHPATAIVLQYCNHVSLVC